MLRLFLRRRRRRREIRLSSIHKNLLVNTGLGLTVLDPLPRRDARLLGVDLEHAQAADVAVVAGVATEADAAGVAHPHRGDTGDFVLGLRFGLEGQFFFPAWEEGFCFVAVAGEGAVVVDVVTFEG